MERNKRVNIPVTQEEKDNWLWLVDHTLYDNVFDMVRDIMNQLYDTTYKILKETDKDYIVINRIFAVADQDD